MNKRVVVLGGGTGSSILLKGLKKFPLDISAIVTVCDDGKSTGKLREELNMPAVGDLRRVLVALSETESIVEKLFNYRFSTKGELDGYAVGNLMLGAAYNINGNLSKAVKSLSKIMNLKGKVIALTEDNVTLMGKMHDGSIIEGEHSITQSWDKKIKKVWYKKEPKLNKEAIKAIRDADYIILSMGSIWTSIIPNLLCPGVKEEIDKSDAKIVYVCNMMTQPGETENYKVSDHIKLLNKYLGKKKISCVIANKQKIENKLKKKYETLEQKNQVILDENNIKDIDIIKSNLFVIEDNMIRHDSIKLAFEIYAYIMRSEG